MPHGLNSRMRKYRYGDVADQLASTALRPWALLKHHCSSSSSSRIDTDARGQTAEMQPQALGIDDDYYEASKILMVFGSSIIRNSYPGDHVNRRPSQAVCTVLSYQVFAVGEAQPNDLTALIVFSCCCYRLHTPRS